MSLNCPFDVEFTCYVPLDSPSTGLGTVNISLQAGTDLIKSVKEWIVSNRIPCSRELSLLSAMCTAIEIESLLRASAAARRILNEEEGKEPEIIGGNDLTIHNNRDEMDEIPTDVMDDLIFGRIFNEKIERSKAFYDAVVILESEIMSEFHSFCDDEFPWSDDDDDRSRILTRQQRIESFRQKARWDFRQFVVRANLDLFEKGILPEDILKSTSVLERVFTSLFDRLFVGIRRESAEDKNEEECELPQAVSVHTIHVSKNRNFQVSFLQASAFEVLAVHYSDEAHRRRIKRIYGKTPSVALLLPFHDAERLFYLCRSRIDLHFDDVESQIAIYDAVQGGDLIATKVSCLAQANVCLFAVGTTETEINSALHKAMEFCVQSGVSTIAFSNSDFPVRSCVRMAHAAILSSRMILIPSNRVLRLLAFFSDKEKDNALLTEQERVKQLI